MATPIRLAALNASIAVGQGSGTEGTNTPPQSHTRTYQGLATLPFTLVIDLTNNQLAYLVVSAKSAAIWAQLTILMNRLASVARGKARTAISQQLDASARAKMKTTRETMLMLTFQGNRGSEQNQTLVKHLPRQARTSHLPMSKLLI